MYRKFSGCLALAFTLTASPLWAVSSDLMNLGIEDLMNIEVTSVSGKGQNLSDSAAAIFVITQDDLKRSGVTNIPDALRMVPGLNVSRIDSNKWAVNSRGANSRFANKLLVMIDGRSVYTNAYSGVYWEVQDVLLEDVDRIEVIRGPGATLWGANAVNGVINIITRHTADTQGGYVELGTGTEEEVFGAARYGFELGDVSYMRLYAKGLGRDNFEYDTGDDAGDEWDMVRTGFRLDSNVNSECTLALQGEVYKGDISQKMFLESLEFPYMGSLKNRHQANVVNLTIT
ncbi:MAG: TonB-dependent receptor plug domain-containing protein, partial [Desulfobulbaceae bacterium]|nr:TonB-dependent receptor plug domain-containing protein [Candidatus Desulfatifera sulfidica]